MKKLLLLIPFILLSCTKESINYDFIIKPSSTPNLENADIISIDVINKIDSLTISKTHKYEVMGIDSDGNKFNISELIEIEVLDNNIAITSNNEIVGSVHGNSFLNIKYKNLKINNKIYVDFFENVKPHEYLTTPINNSKIIVPVVIITYLPVKSGIYVNQDSYPIQDYGNRIYDDLLVSEVQNWVLSNDIKTKFSIEEGSKFRNYNQESQPYVGIKVIKQFNFYEIPKIPNPNQKVLEDGDEGWFPDYEKIFEIINLQHLVDELGVKEVWFNSKSLSIPESNMSSPLTGDVSNSYKEDDLPIYNKTYVVYGNFIHRWYAENIHNRGHQIEAQLSYIDKLNNGSDKFFWQKFVGYPEGNPQPYYRGGRVGSTHFTPNSNSDYDYDNNEYVESDIQQWTPNNLGEKKNVNKLTWKFSRPLPVNLPNFKKMEKYKDLTKNNDVGSDPQGGWLIYWFQSIPGENNNISFLDNEKVYTLNNWWDLFYNWDNAIENNKNLFE